jgi:hypothetical protein
MLYIAMAGQERTYICRTSFLTAEDIDIFVFVERDVVRGENGSLSLIDPARNARFRRYGRSVKEVVDFIRNHLNGCEACREQYSFDDKGYSDVEAIVSHRIFRLI